MSRYVDADGHIMEKTADFIGYLEEPWRSADTVTERRLHLRSMSFTLRD